MSKFFSIKSFDIDLVFGFLILTFFLTFVFGLIPASSALAQSGLLFESLPVPSDPFYIRQSSYFDQIHLSEAWAKTTGSEDIVIAVIDSGVDTDHPDINGNIWFNRGEIPLNGIDDDKNGYVDDLNGWDFLENTSDPHPKFTGAYTFEGINHGTIVSGIAASATNNDEGLAGVCWKCKIMALRAVAGDGTGTTEDVARAIQYATDNGADIINMSFVGALTDEILTSTIQSAYEKGVVMVAAVGNDAASDFLIGGDLDFRPLYPVCSDDGANHILGVGSVDKDNRKSSFSNFGFHCIDINAPGNGIAGPQVFDPRQGEKFNNLYRAGWRGTSMSTPIVAGVAGLVKSINPRLTNEQIISIIRQTGRDISAENPLYIAQLGAGLLDAAKAVQLASATPGLGQGVRAGQTAGKKNIREIIITPASGHKAEVITQTAGAAEPKHWLAFPEVFKGGAVIGSGDVDNDGEREIVAAPGKNGGPQIRIFSSAGVLKKQFFAYDKKYRGSLALAVADMNGDGLAEILTALAGNTPNQVKVFSSQGELLSTITLPGKKWASVPSLAVQDIDNDGQAEIVVGWGVGSLPQVEIFDKLGNKEATWLAYNKSFRGGVRLAVGDVDGDGIKEIITAPGSGGPQIRVFSQTGKVKGQFFAFENSFRGGASVAVGNIDNTPGEEIIVGSGALREAEVRVFRKFGADWSQDSVFTVFEPGFKGGVNVGI